MSSTPGWTYQKGYRIVAMDRTAAIAGTVCAVERPPHRVACVSFFNSRPLIEGLDRPAVRIVFDVPSALIEHLRSGDAEVALLPVIDLDVLPGTQIVPVGGIGCDGPTLTVRIFSRVPLERIGRLACDPDSHTSVQLARVLLAGVYRVEPELVPLSSRASADAILLIGDKVITSHPAGYPHELDLGEAWKRWTGLPFVFAVWAAAPGVEIGDLPLHLLQAKQRGLAAVDKLVAEHAVPRGWPAELAARYLTEYLRFDIGPRQLDAIATFRRLAGRAEPVDVVGQPR